MDALLNIVLALPLAGFWVVVGAIAVVALMGGWLIR